MCVSAGTSWGAVPMQLGLFGHVQLCQRGKLCILFPAPDFEGFCCFFHNACSACFHINFSYPHHYRSNCGGLTHSLLAEATNVNPWFVPGSFSPAGPSLWHCDVGLFCASSVCNFLPFITCIFFLSPFYSPLPFHFFCSVLSNLLQTVPSRDLSVVPLSTLYLLLAV